MKTNGTFARTKDLGLIFVPEQKITRPGLFDLVEPLRGSAHTCAVINAFTGICVGWTLAPEKSN